MNKSTSDAYFLGLDLGQMIRAERADGRNSYDCRWDLADAAKKPGDYFTEFKRGLKDGLNGMDDGER